MTRRPSKVILLDEAISIAANHGLTHAALVAKMEEIFALHSTAFAEVYDGDDLGHLLAGMIVMQNDVAVWAATIDDETASQMRRRALPNWRPSRVRRKL